MKHALFFLFALLWASIARADWRAFPVSSLHKLTATAPGVLETFPTRPATLTAARGETESFQLVVAADQKPVKNLRISATPLASTLGHVIPSENIAIFHERFVEVKKPSGNRQLQPRWWSDALVPFRQSTVEIAPRQSAAFWISVQVPQDAEPGFYFGALDLDSSEGHRELYVGIEVKNATLPAPTMRATAALYYDILRDWHGKNIGPQSDADWQKTKRAYYDFLLQYRINAYDLPVAPDDAAFAPYLRDPRVLSIRTPAPDAPDFAPFVAALKQGGALQKAFSYRHDEPSPETYAAIRSDARKLQAAEVKQLVTVAPHLELENAVDIWCPNIGDALALGHLDLASLARERKKGRETWWYTMAIPRAPHPTWLLDDDAHAIRLFGWQMARWEISGFVYSMVHGWGPKPLESLVSFADTNGDGTLVYPGELVGERGPIPSIRLMLLRDAIEDYELLRSLPDAARLAVTSHAVGATSAQRRDRAKDWTAETYRQKLFTALDKKAVPSAAPLASPTLRISVRRRTVSGTTDGIFSPGEWPTSTRINAQFRRFADDDFSPPATELWMAEQNGSLFVAVRAHNSGTNEWCAVEIADEAGNQNPRERRRFVITAKGKTVVERHSAQGRFSVSDAKWNEKRVRSNSTVLYEWKIPLETLGVKSKFRLNVLRRIEVKATEAGTTRVLLRAWPDDGDITRMAHAEIEMSK